VRNHGIDKSGKSKMGVRKNWEVMVLMKPRIWANCVIFLIWYVISEIFFIGNSIYNLDKFFDDDILI
jgi:hypothetical protein